MTPKERLQKSPQFAEVAKMLNSPLFEHCCEVAMLTYVHDLPVGLDGGNSVAFHQQLVGARNFLGKLRGLGSLASEPAVASTPQFRHDV